MSNGKVLVIDDDPLTVELAAGVLSRAGYDVVRRHNAMGAAAAVVSERPDVVLLDVMMPALHGDELVRQIRNRDTPELARTRFVLYSSCPDLVDRARRSGADGWLHKPAAGQQMIDVVKDQIEQLQESPSELRPLFVDDEEFILRMYRRVFRTYPNAIFARSAAEALEVMARHQPDVVVSDLRMTDLDGDELYRRACAADPSWRYRFIFVTANLALGDVNRTLRRIDVPVFAKPTNHGLLDLTIKRLGRAAA